jgi:manganese transport protein
MSELQPNLAAADREADAAVDETAEEAVLSPAAAAAGSAGLTPARTPGGKRRNSFRSDQIWSYFGPAFVA